MPPVVHACVSLAIWVVFYRISRNSLCLTHVSVPQVFAAFLAMIEADTEAALVLSAWLAREAELKLLTLSRHEERVDRWQLAMQNVVHRRMYALMYDFLYPWMGPTQRDVVRSLLAVATAGSWAIGMYTAGSFGSTHNWLPWVTGELGLNVLAIEGELGCVARLVCNPVQASPCVHPSARP